MLEAERQQRFLGNIYRQQLFLRKIDSHRAISSKYVTVELSSIQLIFNNGLRILHLKMLKSSNFINPQPSPDPAIGRTALHQSNSGYILENTGARPLHEGVSRMK